MNSSTTTEASGVRERLVAAGVDLARPVGPSAVGLRAASRAAGVSHNAAYHYFADHDALLGAVSKECMRHLSARMDDRLGTIRQRDPERRAWKTLYAIGEAYVAFAVDEAGWFRTAFSPRAEPPQALETTEHASADDDSYPLSLLTQCLDELVAVGAVPAARRPGLEFAAWSAVHGFAGLLVDGPLRGLPPRERESALRVVLDVVARGL